jgi:hypothetical protein
MISKSIQEILNYYQTKSIDNLEKKTTTKITEFFIAEVKMKNLRGWYNQSFVGDEFPESDEILYEE